MSDGILKCPLCFAPGKILHRDQTREYYRCSNCDLIFVPPKYHLPPSIEKQRYDWHRNDPGDPGYRTYLNRLALPLQDRLPAGAKGIDIGSGPGPTLHLMMLEAGFRMAIYDPFYANDPALLKDCYDFLTCTETVEHFRQPRKEWELLNRLVKPGGWLGIMTQQLPPNIAFGNWHYRRDDTHVCFYSLPTFQWLAAAFDWKIAIADRYIAIFRKSETVRPA